ncbi:hypothetical protein K503DRAFT_436997 [Rhizopogon vinicolor AM-OR11-026]|uniref:Uncharacterized protein n=1 Tax=Rhizopogon vinicolor AM-OR11-026 TaxID=1314800 RepID=A0A1B7NAF6_9AGAM|nr:hypothetical protein K503DRAFT_436997 [Rhizopogon vinicolor AM-OR11-026]
MRELPFKSSKMACGSWLSRLSRTVPTINNRGPSACQRHALEEHDRLETERNASCFQVRDTF